MPGRGLPLTTGEIYHIYNRGIDRRLVFKNGDDYQRALLALDYYRAAVPPMKLSLFLTLDLEEQGKILREIRREKRLVESVSFCLMPNHFHLLLRQEMDNGISKFMSNLQNSYTRFFNTRYERVGQIFLRPFKAVRIYTEEQLLHVSRYIHLNPYSASVAKGRRELKNYPWSSLPEYLGRVRNEICEKGVVLSSFRDPQSYLEFVLDQADYQKGLEEIKHLVMD